MKGEYWVCGGCGERSHGKVVIENVEWLYRCINGFKYQRRCHKLTLGLVTERLRELRRGGGRGGEGWEEAVEVGYQEPPRVILMASRLVTMSLKSLSLFTV
ncbi:hypothetical protein AKJ16_DCAP12601 [Drosera capensis]